MEVDPSLTLPTAAEVDMADSPAPIPIDPLGDEQMVDDEPTTDLADTIDNGNYAEDEDLALDEDEVAMADEAAEQEQDEMIDDELGYSEPPQFGSLPAGLTNPDGTQTSALGHSAEVGDAQLDPVGSLHLRPFELDDSKIEADLPESAITAQTQVNQSATPYIPEPSVETHDSSHSPQAELEHDESQSASLSPGRALAAQHQHSSDDKKHQDQSISHQNSHHMKLNQSQDMDDGKGDDPAKQKNEVDIEQKEGQPGEKDEVEVTTKQSNEGGQGGKGSTSQSNEVNVYPDGGKGKGKALEGCTCGAKGKQDRPELRKEILQGVEFEEEVEEEGVDGEDGPVRPPLCPVVLLLHQNTTYSLFRPITTPDSNQPLETLFPAAQPSEAATSSTAVSPELYYAPLAALFAALRTTFTQIPSSDEFVISFEAIGISLGEDNVHATQVSLFDFDRIQVGCGLPGRLQLTLETQPRFSTGFNALVEHIARSRDGGEAPLVGSQAGEDEYVGGGEGSFVDGEYAGGEETPVTDDETAVGDESEYYDPEGGEDYNLEEALAEMDSDDLEAVIDGAEEDYIASEEAIYEAHDGDEHDELAEGDDGEPDALLPEEGEEAEAQGGVNEAAVEVVGAALEGEDEAEPGVVGGEPVEVGPDGLPVAAHVSVDGGEGEDELIVAIPPDELEALDEAAELYEAGAQEVEGVAGHLDEVAGLDEPAVAEGESARSLTDTLEDELAEPAAADDVLAEEAAGAPAAGAPAAGAPAAGDFEPDALGLATAVAPEGEAEALGESVSGPKRGREAEPEVEGGEEEAEAATKRAKIEDEDELVA